MLNIGFDSTSHRASYLQAKLGSARCSFCIPSCYRISAASHLLDINHFVSHQGQSTLQSHQIDLCYRNPVIHKHTRPPAPASSHIMPPAAGLGGARPPGAASKYKNGANNGASSSKVDVKALREQAAAAAAAGKDDDDDDDEVTTDDDSSDEEAAFEMDGQELWTQTYCVTCDCLIEPGEGIAKADSSTDASSSPVAHTTLKSRSGTIKARGSNASEHAPPKSDDGKTANPPKESPTATKTGPGTLKRTHSAGRLQAKAGAGPLGPHKRTGSAGSRLHALSELRPTTKLHDDKGKSKATSRDSSRTNDHKSPAPSRPGSAASNRSRANSSGPSSFKSDKAIVGASTSASADGQARAKKRGFLGGLGLTPAALKQQEAELAAKRKAPTPLYCSERCRLIDERRSSGLGELTQYLSQPLQPPTSAAWAPQTPAMWPRSASVSSMPLPNVANTPESECLCPECMDKYGDGSSASGAGVPSGASDTATESSNGYVYGRNAGQKPRTDSGRLITPLGLHAPGAGSEGYFPQFALGHAMTSTGNNSPRVRPVDAAYNADSGRGTTVPPRTSSAASGGRSSTAGTDGSALSSESGSSLWEPRLKTRSNSASKNGNGSYATMRNGRVGGDGTPSGLSTNTGTPAITPRQSMIMPSSASYTTARGSHRLSVPGFAPTHEVDEESHRATSPAGTLPQRPGSSSKRSSLLLATSPLNLLNKTSQHHAAPSVDLFSDHVGSPSARGSLLSRSLASEHTLMGASGITLTNHGAPTVSSSMQDQAHLDGVPAVRQSSQDTAGDRRISTLSQSLSANTSDRNYEINEADDGLSMAVGSLKLAQSRASGPMARTTSRRGTDTSDTRPTDLRRLSLFGVAGFPERRNSNAVSISSSASGSGSTTSGWLRSLSSAWLNWRSTASPAPMQGDSEVFHTTDDSDEWPSRGSEHISRRESSTSRSSSSHKVSFAQKRASSVRDLSMAESDSHNDSLRPAEMSRHHSTGDRSAGITPTQSLVAKPTIRRGHVPAYVREIGQGGIPGDASAEAKADEAAAYADPAQRLARARVDSFTRVSDAEKQRKANRRKSREITVLPPLLAPISRSGSSTNLYNPAPRSARAYSTGRAWTAANTPQMYVGSAGSSHQQAVGPSSPTLMRSPYNSSFALAQDAARAALSPSRPNSAAGYHTLYGSAGTSPRAKGLGWGAMTSIASPPASSASTAFPHHQHHQQHHHGHRQSISYGHAAAMAHRQTVDPSHKGHHGHQHSHHHGGHHHQHQHQHQHHCGHHHGNHQQGHGQHSSAERAKVTTGHMMNLGAPPNHNQGQPVLGRHSTMPVTLHRSPTPSVPEDGGEMTSQDLTSGDFVSRPKSAMANQNGRRHHRTSLMPPPRSRSSLGMHRMQPLASTDTPAALTPASEEIPPRNLVELGATTTLLDSKHTHLTAA